jgi:PKD repeat protein
MQLILMFIVLVFSASVLAQAPPPAAAPSEAPAPIKEHARVFITDSQSWEVGGGAGGSAGTFGAESHGGARPQTAEIIKTFGERCPEVVTNNIQTKTDYIVVLDHEVTPNWRRSRQKKGRLPPRSNRLLSQMQPSYPLFPIQPEQTLKWMAPSWGILLRPSIFLSATTR